MNRKEQISCKTKKITFNCVTLISDEKINGIYVKID